MINYTILEKLGEDCQRLLNNTTGLNIGTHERSIHRLNERLIGAYRKIVIANEVSGKYIVCVSGLQGAGKTTFIKNFYGLDEKYFNISLERGEKIPVFICEKQDCETPQMFAICLIKNEQGMYERKTVTMNENEFKSASMGFSVGEQVMYLELWVPYTHFYNENSAFMLLPGFEKKNDYWRALIEFSVKCSHAAIFVFNESSFAKYDNKVLVDKIKDQFGDSLIYAISQSDLKPDGNEQVKQTCIEVMGIKKHEEDRVVCIGAFQEKDKNETWIIDMQKAIDKYCNSEVEAARQCADYIYETIENDIRPALEEIQEKLGSDTGELLETELKNSSILNSFEKVVKDRRKTLEDNLDKALNKSFRDSSDKLQRLFEDDDYAREQGLEVSYLDTVRRTLFGKSLKDIRIAKERINIALKDEGKETYAFQNAFVEAVGASVSKLEEVSETRKIFLVDMDENSGSGKLPKTSSGEISLTNNERKNEILHDVFVLLDNDNLSDLCHNDVQETIKVTAELGVQSFAVSAIGQCAIENGDFTSLDSFLGEIEFSTDELTNKISGAEKVALTALGMIGIDILPDQELNMIPAIAEALGTSVTKVASAFAGIVGAEAAIMMVKETNRLKVAEFESAKSVLYSIESQVKKCYLDAYDDSMGKIRDRIEENLIKRTLVNKNITKKLNATTAITRINEDLDLISREVVKNIYDFANCFK